MDKEIDTIKNMKENGAFKKYIEYIVFPYYKNLVPGTKINLEFPITILVGKNGSGKSSTLHALYGAPYWKSCADFWFSTEVDPIEETGGEGKNRFFYGYREDKQSEIKEVMKTRMRRGSKTKEEDPDYWETSKNELVYEYIRIINELEPSFILMENVPGMSTGVGKEIFKNVVKELEENYHVEYATLNAADFGVPQIRKRLVLHGIRNDVYDNLGLDKEKQKILPKSTHSKEKKKGYRKWVTVRKAIFDLPILGAGESYDDGIIKNHKARSLSETNIERLQEIRLHGGNREMISEELQLECHKKENVSYTDTYGIIDPDKPAPTITSGCTIISKGRYCHPTQNRGLSIREAARLQSFDDKFEFQGNMGEMSLQIGNAVPPKLAQASGKVIINYMGLYEDYLEAQTKGVITP